jgi:hypothetical protein
MSNVESSERGATSERRSRRSKKLGHSVWISFDLGLDGDYASLFEWLDANNAVECGEGFARVPEYEYGADVVETLRKSLSGAMTVGKRTRIYVIFTRGNKARGEWLFGGRRRAPWEGYVQRNTSGEES